MWTRLVLAGLAVVFAQRLNRVGQLEEAVGNGEEACFAQQLLQLLVPHLHMRGRQGGWAACSRHIRRQRSIRGDKSFRRPCNSPSGLGQLPSNAAEQSCAPWAHLNLCAGEGARVKEAHRAAQPHKVFHVQRAAQAFTQQHGVRAHLRWVRRGILGRQCSSINEKLRMSSVQPSHQPFVARPLPQTQAPASPPTSCGRRRSQYTSEKNISPPGASTRYTSRSTLALSGDRLICSGAVGGRKCDVGDEGCWDEDRKAGHACFVPKRWRWLVRMAWQRAATLTACPSSAAAACHCPAHHAVGDDEVDALVGDARRLQVLNLALHKAHVGGRVTQGLQGNKDAGTGSKQR